MLLQECDYTVEHRSFSSMKHVDVLSRFPILTITIDDVTQKIKYAQAQADELRLI